MTDDLIDRLATNLAPVRPYALGIHIAVFAALGIVVSGALMLWTIGPRADLAAALGTPIFWTKFGYTLALAGFGFVAVRRMARPGGTARGALLLSALAFGAVVASAITQLIIAPEDARTLVFGSSSLVCPLYIGALSIPVFAALVLVMRRLAPTDLTLAGLAAGLLAGGSGALVYSFHCGENGLPFLALWYTLGIALTAAFGALAGRVLLRW